MSTDLIDHIDALLPQTQCTQCGFNGCKPYAEAIAKNQADINQCPPGGQTGIDKLADLLNIASKPLNAEHGIEQPRQIAFIIEQDCIGCTKCLPPCPVDAILGANKYMHTVIAHECSGCGLCIDPCPVNCIVMQAPQADNVWDEAAQNHARQRHQAKLLRQTQLEKEKAARAEKQKQLLAKLKAAKNN